MVASVAAHRRFRKAVILSSIIHLALLGVLILSPKLPGSSRKGLIHYIPLNLGGWPGGGGGGGGARPAAAEAKKPSLRDLTTPQKAQEQAPEPKLRHPAEKPDKDAKPTTKQAAITQPSPADKVASNGQEAGPGGSGVRLGLGGGTGDGTGTGYGDQIGLSDFPYTYYLQNITDRVSANWFTSLVDPGVRGHFQTVIHFKIFRNGQTSDVSVKESSGIRSLDLSALRAIQNASPFPPLPSDYEGEYLGIFLIFEHSK